jgi:hypothetical protein
MAGWDLLGFKMATKQGQIHSVGFREGARMGPLPALPERDSVRRGGRGGSSRQKMEAQPGPGLVSPRPIAATCLRTLV